VPPALQKHADISRNKKKARKATSINTSTANDTPKSPFLELPAELRNTVLEYAAATADEPAVLRPNGKGQLRSTSPLMRVSRQIRDEFQAALYVAAPLLANVKDFNFAHVVAFLNKLTDRGLNPLPSIRKSKAAKRERTMTIALHISANCPLHSDDLDRWLARRNHPTKKGSRIRISYQVYGVHRFSPETCHASITKDQGSRLKTRALEAGARLAIPHAGTPVGEVMRVQKEGLRKMKKAGLRQSRVYWELKQIRKALRKPLPPVMSAKERAQLEWEEANRKAWRQFQRERSP